MARRRDGLGVEAVLRDHLGIDLSPFFAKKGSDPIGFWTEVVDRADAALAAGVMHSFECALEFVEDAGVEFVLRIATNRSRVIDFLRA